MGDFSLLHPQSLSLDEGEDENNTPLTIVVQENKTVNIPRELIGSFQLFKMALESDPHETVLPCPILNQLTLQRILEFVQQFPRVPHLQQPLRNRLMQLLPSELYMWLQDTWQQNRTQFCQIWEMANYLGVNSLRICMSAFIADQCRNKPFDMIVAELEEKKPV